jgi:uncharacterized protein (DUF983 family)
MWSSDLRGDRKGFVPFIIVAGFLILIAFLALMYLLGLLVLLVVMTLFVLGIVFMLQLVPPVRGWIAILIATILFGIGLTVAWLMNVL